MKYKHIAKVNDLDSLYNEVRTNIIRVNNRFCTKSCKEDGKNCLDLWDMFVDPTIDVSPIINLALEVEGLPEALEDATIELHWSKLKEIAYRLEKEMLKLF